MTKRNLAISASACMALAAASLLIAAEPVYDAWAWLVWGRELAHLQLDTSSGPSWKPLPVLLATPLSLAGDAAPALWLLIVRASWLLALVLAGALAHQLTAGLDRTPRIAAAAFAALSLALLADDVTLWARQGAAGMSEPLLVVLVLGAVAAALDGHSRVALALGALAALVRPEVWPLLGAYGIWRWREEPALRPWLASVAVAVPALWIVPDLLASGGAANAAERARRDSGTPAHDLLEAVGRGAAMPLLAAWPLALLAAARARERDPVRVLAAGALAWIAIVSVMAAGGFPGLPRFMAPAAAVAGVLGGAGLAMLLAAPRSRPATWLLALLAIATLVQLPARAERLPRSMTITARIAHEHDRLAELTQRIGRERLLRCGRLATSDVLVRTALAWELGVPLGRVVSFGVPSARSGAFVIGPQATPLVRSYLRGHADLLGSNGEWRVYSVGCPPTGAAISSSSASPRITGVSGALR